MCKNVRFGSRMFVEHNTVSYVQELWRNVCKSVRLYNYTIFICECVCVCVCVCGTDCLLLSLSGVDSSLMDEATVESCRDYKPRSFLSPSSSSTPLPPPRVPRITERRGERERERERSGNGTRERGISRDSWRHGDVFYLSFVHRDRNTHRWMRDG